MRDATDIFLIIQNFLSKMDIYERPCDNNF